MRTNRYIGMIAIIMSLAFYACGGPSSADKMSAEEKQELETEISEIETSIEEMEKVEQDIEESANELESALEDL
ncbi:MAG: hypothetical protein HKN45_03630 [Flavobacteriales bacterium]|nr:hypothetical protein [Flavobacteriales bacterium]